MPNETSPTLGRIIWVHDGAGWCVAIIVNTRPLTATMFNRYTGQPWPVTLNNEPLPPDVELPAEGEWIWPPRLP